MPEFKGTQGEWKVIHSPSGRPVIYSGETCIADVWFHGDGHTEFPIPEIGIPNGQLISAAPDLLNACLEFMKLFRDSDMRPEDECHEIFSSMQDAVKKAIGD